MNTPIWLQIVLPLLPTIAVILGSWLTRRAVEQVHIAVNSRMTELLKAVGESERLKGQSEGQATEKLDQTEREKTLTLPSSKPQ